ncbi:Hypothetical predicted protein [Olea europaea subsp. europaea]|uniref:DUF7725 domain-containing protein n=1 Tax=Olea europaea subsp. europaea TaxID=158383 RepID=A0A8S0T4W1_OLEEU|nr:Hypothetical predicted protein [Olea europaea subsp. europaea]
MEAAAGVAVARGVSMPMSTSSQPSRKEWRAVSEQSARNLTSEDMELSKLGQSDERLIYEVQQGREHTDVDFCTITIDRGLDNDILQQKLLTVVKQREELQHMEIELQAQVVIRSEIMEMQKSYDAQIKEHANANVKFQEQLHEKEQIIHELERKMEDKARELNAIRLDKEAAWAKEDLLREQSKELQSFRRERDSTEAERALHIRQIHDFQEHLQEKEQQLMELQDQHRVAQETIVFKDEQLREAQAWMTRAQEMDALQSTTNHSLQAELRERVEQYNQLWLVCQRQFGEMERFHLHIQQLQLELADAREKSGSYSDASHISQINPKDASEAGQSNGSQLEVKGNGTPSENSGSVQNGNVEGTPSFVPGVNTSMQTDVHGVPFAPPSLLGLPPYLPPVQVTALHPFVMHQGVPHTVPSHVTQSIFQTIPAMSSLQPSQNLQTVSDGQQMPVLNQFPLQAEQTSSVAVSSYDYEASVNGQVLSSNYFDANISRGMEPNSIVPPPNKEGQAFESVDESYPDVAQSYQSLQQVSSQFHDVLRLDPLEHNNETKDKNDCPVTDHRLENRNSMVEQPSSSVNAPLSESPNHAVNISKITMNTASAAVSSVVSDVTVYPGQKNSYVIEKPAEISLLDERSLLACIVRTIGSGGRIRIGSTLPNRLGKMLAPLHWHDYKKKYGKLDDFVAGHAELFVIEGDYIQLREGAQEIIAATAAVAKVAAAPSSYPTLLPSMAVTPMAQAPRMKVSSLDFTSADANKTNFNEIAASRPSHLVGNPSMFSAIRNQNMNGASFSVAGGVSNIKILSKPKDHMEQNGSENSEQLTVGNGINTDTNGVFQRKDASHGKSSVSLIGKHQGRATGAASSPRR